VPEVGCSHLYRLVPVKRPGLAAVVLVLNGEDAVERALLLAQGP
jgi:hypothetical protein